MFRSLPRSLCWLHAAGSLRPALTEIGKAFEGAYGVPVQVKFGASSVLRDEIANGAKPKFAMFILAPEAQQIPAKHGFDAPGVIK
jgi:molybdate transport system substrate-binding protein